MEDPVPDLAKGPGWIYSVVGMRRILEDPELGVGEPIEEAISVGHIDHAIVVAVHYERGVLDLGQALGDVP